ncbi:T9SS type A sorting domain-containing protein [bacterium]|nr:T9SS type A sorting domain-containing protein [bacterium]
MKRLVFSLALFVVLLFVGGLYAEVLVNGYINILRLNSDLRVEAVDTFDYEADSDQTFGVWVVLSSLSPTDCNDVVVELSADYYTVSPSVDTLSVLRSGQIDSVYFSVAGHPLRGVKLFSPHKDSLYAHIIGGTDGDGDLVVEHITDNDLLIKIEAPAHLVFQSTEFVAGDVPNSPDVTEGERFRLMAEVRNTGDDAIDSVAICIRNSTLNPVPSVLIDTMFILRDFAGGSDTTLFFLIEAAPNQDATGALEEQFVVDMSWGVANNTGTAPDVDYVDNTEDMNIQYPPEFDLFDMHTDVPWLNKSDTLRLTSILGNLAGDYATADSLTSYSHYLELYIPSTTTEITGVGGLGAPTTAFQDRIEAGDFGQFDFSLYNEGASHQGLVDVREIVYFHDENYPSQGEPLTSPDTILAFGVFGIDTEDPSTEITNLNTGWMNDVNWPDSVYGKIFDATSGPDSVYYAVENDTGCFWNGGTDWVVDTVWFEAELYDDTLWVGELPEPGIAYTIYAWGVDVAGNHEETPDIVSIIFDNTSPMVEVIYPDAGIYPPSGWGDTISVIASDDSSGIGEVYVAIYDSLTGKYWDDSTSTWGALRRWNPATHTIGDHYLYDFVPGGETRIFKIYALAYDRALNHSEIDSVWWLYYDRTRPHSEVTNIDTTFYNAASWVANGEAIEGWSTDSQFTYVDSTRLMIYNRDKHLWWNGTEWVGVGSWVLAGVNVLEDDTLYWSYPMPLDDMLDGQYELYTRAYDHLGNIEVPELEDTFDLDRTAPVITPVYPLPESIYNAAEWLDTVKVHVVDTSVSYVDSVLFAFYSEELGAYWNWSSSDWSSPVADWNVANQAGDYYWWPITCFADGEYELKVRAVDGRGNDTTRVIRYYINNYGTYLVIEGPEYGFVGVPFDMTITACRSDESIDSSYSYPLEVLANKDSSLVDFPSSPFYLTHGTITVSFTVNAPMVGLRITVRSLDGPPLMDVSDPISIIEVLDLPDFVYIYDNPSDQGDTLVLVSDLSENDPYSPGFVPGGVEVTEYIFYRDVDLSADTLWVPIDTIMPAARDSIMFKFTCGGSFDTYDYSYIITANAPSRLLSAEDFVLTSGRIPIGSYAPEDNIPPDGVTGIDIAPYGANYWQLSWDAVTVGEDGTPEINPSINIEYEVYRLTEPYGGLGDATLIGTTGLTSFIDDDIGGADVRGDADNNYFYFVRAKDTGPNYGDISGTVGEFDFALGTGFTSVGKALVMPSLDSAHAFPAITPNFEAVSRYVAGSGWEQWVTGTPIFDFPVTDGMAVWLATSDDGVLTLYGTPPGATDIYFDLIRTTTSCWNAITVPLPITYIEDAEDLYTDIPNCDAVARWVPGGGWEQWVVGTSIFNFDVYRGYPYMVSVTENGTWPSYSLRKLSTDIVDGSEYAWGPKLVWTETEGTSFRAYIVGREDEVLTESSFGCALEQNILAVQVGNFPTHWKVGDILHIDILDGDRVLASYDCELDYLPVTRLEKPGISAIPNSFRLGSAYPNPFNTATAVTFDLPKEEFVTIDVINLLGENVKTLVSDTKPAGSYTAIWDGTDESGNVVSAGIYFYRMQAGSFTSVGKMVFVK